MNSNSTGANAAGSYGAAGLIMTIIVWVAGLLHLTIPVDVAAAMGALLGMVLHSSYLKMFTDPITPAQSAAVEVVKADPAPLVSASASDAGVKAAA